jgi:hypothetical protein
MSDSNTTGLHTSITGTFNQLNMNPEETHEQKKRKLAGTPDPETPDPETPAKDSSYTPPTVLVGTDGNYKPGQEGVLKQHDEYDKSRKYKMVPYNFPVNMRDVFVKQPDDTFVPLLIKGKTFVLAAMNAQDFRDGIQPYNYEGIQMGSDNLFSTSHTAKRGGSKKRRRTRRGLSKKKHNTSKKPRK